MIDKVALRPMFLEKQKEDKESHKKEKILGIALSESGEWICVSLKKMSTQTIICERELTYLKTS